jgi:diguanylate cyclase (GGDEF)-like protein
MGPLAIHYSYGLVAVSVLTSMIAAYSAFSLADRMRQAVSRGQRRWWLLGGSVAMGTGIWSMHYLGMLAVELPIPVFYFLPTVLLSLLMAILASTVALSVVSAEKPSRWQLLGGGVLMGAGIGGMHYTGMAAMRMSAMSRYNPWVVALSVLVAVGFSWMAVGIGFSVRDRQKHGEWQRVAGGAVMGLGIAAMHYTAMAGVRFMPSGMGFSQAWTVQVGLLGTVGVVVVTAMVLATALGIAALYKRRFRELEASQAGLLEAQEQLQEANAMLSELSYRDGLTGLFNRRHFDSVFDTEFRRAARARTALAVLMVDVDHFKAYNDTYGHQQGDDCLRDVARVLEDGPRRRHDCVARYGGEEFVVLLPGADAAAGMKIGESLREAVLALRMEHSGSETVGLVTVSIGVCSRSPKVGEAAETMLRDADTALYIAKGTGRNRVAIAGEVNINAEC